MTSKSKFRSTLEYGSDMVYDFTCHSCQDEKKNTEANFFCKDCSQCFCDSCVKHHNKVLKRHAVLGREDVDKWSTDAALVGPLVRCDSHPGEILKLYCGDHRRLCCPVCISVDHKYVKFTFLFEIAILPLDSELIPNYSFHCNPLHSF